jgi:16S rRNA (adenine1518-N6/adenine1519-N6)-dimethyltransferase
VLEVGPGPGGLTRALLARPLASLLACELDTRAIAALAELAEPRLTVLHQDALKLDAVAALEAPRQIVANLPYNVGTPLLIGWLRQAGAFERLTLMFQQEVAERICAAPDTEHYGRLAVLSQWLCRCTVMLHLPPGAFFPPPRVHSAVVGLVPHAEQPAPALLAAMERLTAAAFGQRRKMLRGSLKALGGADRRVGFLRIDQAPHAALVVVGGQQIAELCGNLLLQLRAGVRVGPHLLDLGARPGRVAGGEKGAGQRQRAFVGDRLALGEMREDEFG